VVPELIFVLKVGDSDADRLVINTLALIGPGARAAVPALMKALRRKDLAPIVADALKKIDPEAAAKAGIR